jgi:CheY-like chemotaxis protein
MEEEKQTGSILVAEDYVTNQELIKMHLTNAGYDVVIAPDGVKAVEATKTTKFNIILMDLQMPEMDGLTASQEIRKPENQNKKVPIIALTANTNPDVLEKCEKAGMDDVMVKPIRRRSFLAGVSKWVKKNIEKDTKGDQSSQKDESTESESQNMPCFNYAEAILEFGGNKMLLDVAIQRFLKAAEKQIVQIEESLQGEDHEDVRKEAHKIRGGAGNLTAMALSKEAESLEASAEKENLDEEKTIFENVKKEFDLLKKALKNQGIKI